MPSRRHFLAAASGAGAAASIVGRGSGSLAAAPRKPTRTVTGPG